MYIKHLEIKNFRNYEDLSIDFDPRVNLIAGSNAQGKTNLIEAVYLTSMGRSFRTAHDADLIRFGQDRAFIRVEAEKAFIDTKVEVRINRQSKKSILKDGSVIRKTSELMKNIIIVVFSPEDLRSVKDEPATRRRFIDRELSQIQPAYFSCLSGYRKALLQRNSYLKNERIDPGLLDLWDAEIVKYGAELMQLRKAFVDQISILSGRIHSRITNRVEELEVVYDPNLTYDPDRKEQEKIIAEALKASRDSDRRMRTTFRGPHKDDMQFFVNGVNCRKYGSQGQQRTAALSLKLAELDFIREETGENGILLLDDVMSELDASRREYLIRSLEENQLFVTATDVDEGLLRAYGDAKIIRIRDGHVIRQDD